uniref:Retrovirus-related Pol polyprotein from transposon TNT 1-94 n=1 Tax=Cannabis sativa TaxID=3483 RepID=A0A803NGK0_CANSA
MVSECIVTLKEHSLAINNREEDRCANKVTLEIEDWEQQDNIIVSRLLSSMPKKVLTRIIGFESVAQIWINLSEYYTSLNRAKIGKYKTLLCNTMMSPNYISNGLPAEYNVFITFVNTRIDAYNVAEIEVLLMPQEVKLDKVTKEIDIAKVEANLAHTKNQTSRSQ